MQISFSLSSLCFFFPPFLGAFEFIFLSKNQKDIEEKGIDKPPKKNMGVLFLMQWQIQTIFFLIIIFFSETHLTIYVIIECLMNK